jgi:hypothetical protein
MRAYTACLFAAFVWGAPESARAWTEAKVISVEAQVDVRDPEVARVELWLRVLVRQGALSAVTFEGLDPDFRLTELVAPLGAALPIVTQNGPGQLELRWPDAKDAPKPGEHSVRVVYATSQLYEAAKSEGTSRVAWTLPRWPDRLSNVHVTVIGPAGLVPLRSEPNLGEQIESVPEEAPRMLTFTRIELPRLTPYEIQFEVPQRTATAAAGGRPIEAWTSADLVRACGRELPSLLVGLCFGVLVVGKRRVRRRRLVARRMLVPALERKSFDQAIFVLASAAPMLFSRTPTIALAAAFLAVASALEERRPARQILAAHGGGPRRGEATDPGQEETPRRWLTAKAALDATTPAGIVCLAALLVAAFCVPEPLHSTALICGWLATPLFFSGTRLSARDA